MPPDAFMFDTSGQLVMQTAIGGAGTLFGPLVVAAVWLYLSDFFQNTLHLGATWKLVLGLIFVLLVCFLRRGIIGGIVDLVGLVPWGKRAAGETARVGGRGGGRTRAGGRRGAPQGCGGADAGTHERACRLFRTNPARDRRDQALWRPPC